MAESEFLTRLNQVLDMTPDAMKRGVTCFPAALLSMTFTVNEYQKTVKPLTQLRTYIRNGESVVPEVANSILDQCAINNPIVTQNRNGLYQALVQPETVSSEQVTLHLQQVVQSTVDTLLGFSAINSFLSVVMDTNQLWMVWEVIKDARNLANEWPEKNTEITENLQKILGEIIALKTLIRHILDGLAEVKVTYQAKAMRQVDKIRSMLNDVEKSIKLLQINIDKNKRSLLDVRQHTSISAMTNTVTGVTTATTAILFWSNANPWLLGLSALLVLAHGILTIANFATCMMTRQDLEKIEAELGALDKLERERRNLMSTLESEEEQLWNLIGE